MQFSPFFKVLHFLDDTFFRPKNAAPDWIQVARCGDGCHRHIAMQPEKAKPRFIAYPAWL